MPRGAAAHTNGGRRLISGNEVAFKQMRNSGKRRAVCTLCNLPRHYAGTKCDVVVSFGAQLISPSAIPTYSAKLGNPLQVLVEKPDTAATKQLIEEWIHPKEKEIPPSTKHIVITRCFYPPGDQTQSYSLNVIEVHLLEEGGRKMEKFSPAYFHAVTVTTWVSLNCTKARKKHLLWAVRDANPVSALGGGTYSPS